MFNSLVENCNKILLNAASESDMFFSTKQRNTIKPCFNRDCFIKHKKYFKARNTNWKFKSAEKRTYIIFFSLAYEYRKEINK